MTKPNTLCKPIAMHHVVHSTLADLSPGFFVNYLTLSVDRVFVRESVVQVGDPPHDVKEFDSVDFICWDRQGTRILCSLVNHQAVAVHGHMISQKKTYRVSRYSIAEPGYGLHERFHIRFDELTSVESVDEPFVDRVFKLRTPCDLPTCMAHVGEIYDVCGYVKHASPVAPYPHDGYVEKEFIILFEARLKSEMSEDKATAIVHLRGSWVEHESEHLRDLIQRGDSMPFILIKRLKLARPTFTGRPVLNSICDATKVVYDINIQEVLEKRAELICG